jgi:2-polyprenyl-3-methyl-5-hydroxy-6-metoxy-1,4-benzoquinol methylase
MFAHDEVYARVADDEEKLQPGTTLGKILRHVRPGQRVLDVGCGAGRLAKHLSLLGAEVVGVERQPEAAALARQYCKRVIERDLDSQHLLASDDVFDVMVFADVLEHLAEPDALLQRLAGNLATNGIVLISVPNIAYYKIRLKLLRGDFQYEPSGIMDRSHLRFFTRRTSIQLLRDGGFTPTLIDAAYHVPFGRLDRYWSTMHSCIGPIAPTLFATQWVLRAERACKTAVS